MSEEVVDTTQTPAEPGAEPTEPTEPENIPDEQVQEPAYITADQMQQALEKQDASFRSWLGRRDKETLSHIGDVISERMTAQQTIETPDELSSRLLENPREIIRAEMAAYQSEMTQKQTAHLNSTMETVGQLMESEPLYTDKELGNEVVTEIKNMISKNKIEPDLPAAQAGRVMLGEALSAVMRKRHGKKVNPLTNTPQNVGSGLQPPAGRPNKVKTPKLDNVTAAWAKKWNYSDEDLAKLYGE